eukprot:CAMPEP_0197131776 /NCGR_PEP_ID=MMETSP1390-20130617/22574_1 /TAXON_ID=38833 /ORGANISM="Micromonas sp., Strain CCMP2099" /LENGTH=79 /DNA_ID=CAMNT_0042574367 /DNA_START=344 /DNA_END=580 /DNA_ORIENTATION=+
MARPSSSSVTGFPSPHDGVSATSAVSPIAVAPANETLSNPTTRRRRDRRGSTASRGVRLDSAPASSPKWPRNHANGLGL